MASDDDVVTWLRSLPTSDPPTYGDAMRATAADEIERLRAAVEEFLAAEAAVEEEADRSAKENRGWSSAPMMRRLNAVKAMRAAISHEQRTEQGDGRPD